MVYWGATVGEETGDWALGTTDTLLRSTPLSTNLSTSSHPFQESATPLTEVEISTETVASLVASGHELHIGAEEEATQ